MRENKRNDDGFTGLEAAIVLIAFVVVAAVFSYVVLGAGFFTTQKSQEVVHTGVAQASSNIEVSGPVIVGAGNGTVENITFYLQLAAGGAAVDMDKVTYAVSTSDALVEYLAGDVTFTWYIDGALEEEPGNKLLEKFEFVKVTIGDVIDHELPEIKENKRFTVEVRPAVGAAYPIQRNAPPYLEAGKFYEVY
ncbi:flagellin flab1 [hydrocarbon metagenome]|uniref:Flagellin flab1 n=1 Tax=hydrocarbon metagenome TaxID=938273 RepID=A0A0W8FE69_9ZZZZ